MLVNAGQKIKIKLKGLRYKALQRLLKKQVKNEQKYQTKNIYRQKKDNKFWMNLDSYKIIRMEYQNK